MAILQDNYMDNFIQSVFSCMQPYKKPFFNGGTEICDCGDYYQMQMALPGFTKDNVKIELKEESLVVTAERKETNDAKEDYFQCESFWSKSYYVGTEVSRDDIVATFEDGLLLVEIQKKKKAEDK